MRFVGGLAASLLAVCAVEKGRAADLVPAASPGAAYYAPMPAAGWRVLDEVRLGAFAHDPGSPEVGSVDVNAEALSSRLELIDPASRWAWLSPRLHLGGTLNTDDRTSHAYAGLTWTVDLTESVFVEASFGGALHDGDTGGEFPPRGRSALGCSPLFRESASLGVRLGENWTVMATVEHLSNAGLCDANRGLTNYGGRLGYRF